MTPTKTTIKQKGGHAAKETARQVVALWRLITTVAQAMGAYILIPQDNLVFKIVGAVLLANAGYTAVVNFTRK